MTEQLALQIESGPAQGRSFTVGPDGFTVGRQAGNDLALEDGETSRRHARFDYREGFLTVTDLDSANGTTVNGQPITGTRTLAAGDVVQIGTSAIRVIGDPAIPLSPATTVAASVPQPPPYIPAVAPPAGGAAPPAGRSRTLPLILGIGGAVIFLCLCLVIAMAVLLSRADGGASSDGPAGPIPIAVASPAVSLEQRRST